ncbi:MAG TPA: malate synthase A, partial [Candidatus Eisenbacteria bacterium]|nr:malate synthase A [Candidatus Eisenbacteria bacterium]
MDPAGVRIVGPEVPGSREILTPEALDFLAGLQRAFGARRTELLTRRAERQAAIDADATLGLLPETAAIRL